MADIVINLDKDNIEAAVAALDVLSLFSLKEDTSYPFLEERNWRNHDWRQKVFRFGNKTVVTPIDTFKAFMIISDKMKSNKMGYAVANTLRKALTCLKGRKERLGILPTIGGTIIYMGGPHDAASESMVYWEVALQTIVLIAQHKSMDVLESLDRGDHVYLQPPV